MAVNTDQNFPPSGPAPYRIDRSWCLGDSLAYINANTTNFDSRIDNLSGIFTTRFNYLSGIFPLTSQFIAGSAITITKMAHNSVGEMQLVDQSVTGNKIRINSVSGDRLTDGSIPGSKIAPFAIQASNLNINSVTESKIIDQAVTPAKLSQGRMYWTSTGNIGVGTDIPSSRLDIVGSFPTGNGPFLKLTNLNNNASDTFGPSIIFTTNRSGEIPVTIGVRQNDSRFYISQAVVPFTEFFTVLNNGNVGIGNTAPANKLQVSGTIGSTGNLIVNNASPSLFLQDSDNRSAIINCNSNILYFLRTSGNNSLASQAVNNVWPLTLNLENNNAEFGGSLTINGNSDNTNSFVSIKGNRGNFRFINFASRNGSPSQPATTRFDIGLDNINETGSNTGSNFFIHRFSDAGTYLGKPFSITRSTGDIVMENSLTVNSSDTTGGGIILSNDGDIVDLNDGFCSMRFSSGIRIYSGNKTGTPAITLTNGGNIVAIGSIAATHLSLSAQGGNQGGEIQLARPTSGTNLNGNIIVDLSANRFRVFENGGTNRGVYFDFTEANSLSELWHDDNTAGKIDNSKIALNTITGNRIAPDTITAAQIAPNAIGASELADNSVDTNAIINSAVTTIKLDDGAVTSIKIAADTITAVNIAPNAIGASELADNSVDTNAIINSAVTGAKIASNTITAAQIAPNAIGSSELANSAVDTAAIASYAVTSDKIANNTITAAQIAPNAIGASELADNSVDNSALQNNSVSYDKLQVSVRTELVPPGAVMAFARSTAPSGWIICNGAPLDTGAYTDLFNAIGYTFGGSGNNFNIPDLRGRFIRGLGGSSAGFGGVQSDAIQNIWGQFMLRGTEGCDVANGAFAHIGSGGANGAGHNGNSPWNPLIDFNASRVVRTAGETRPTNMTLIYCIKI